MKNAIVRRKAKKVNLSVIVIAKNEELKIYECLKSASKYADEIVLVDSGSMDKTVQIAKGFFAKVLELKNGSYSDWRNAGLKIALGKWIFYLDADERLADDLGEEILGIIKSEDKSLPKAYAVPRRNFILGKEMRYGGQWPDYQKRFFLKKSLIGYKNDLHEEAIYKGELGYLTNPIIHLKHDNLTDMVTKTNKWSLIEAKMLYEAKHPKMVWWRFLRIMFSELIFRMVVQKSYKDGIEGIIYAIYQMWSKFFTYAKLWELQIVNEKLNESRNL
ncbi:MAG: glycosyltransferase family 2 protein [Patescibacteria group bacterium]|nr:glycosyltransferase family 2 protein [Patescibacteria group bacterium]